jgi:hypothetical protein
MKGMISTLRSYLIKFSWLIKSRVVLLLIDLEHFSEENFKLQLKNHGFILKEDKLEQIAKNAFCANVQLGDKSVNIYIAVQGCEEGLRNIEHHIIHLIKLQSKREVKIDEKNKGEIKEKIVKSLKESNLSISDLISKASHQTLENAFPQIVTVLKNVEKLAV